MRAVKTDENRTEYTAIGHAANLAARMQPLAPIGSIAVTEHLRRLGEGYFQFRAMGEAHVKGVTDPVNVYEVSGLGQLRTRLQIAAERGLTKFTGRQGEIEQIRRLLDLVKSDVVRSSPRSANPASANHACSSSSKPSCRKTRWYLRLSPSHMARYRPICR